MALARRAFLQQSTQGLAAMALSTLLRSSDSSAGGQRHAGKARTVIWLFMNGGPSHIDLFDPKPALAKWDGKPFPGEADALFPNPGPVMKSPFRFRQYGESGAWVSEVFPHLARHVDDIAFVCSCTTKAKNHGPALYSINTGSLLMGAPHLGAWATYGLGSANEDLPAFVAMYDHRSCPETGVQLWGAGYLPSKYQGVTFRPGRKPILYVGAPKGVSRRAQRAQLDYLLRLNRRHIEQRTETSDLEARIASFETAFRMQISVPELTDLSQETRETRTLYGLDDPRCRYFGTQLLLARRMAERGVRFIQIYHGGAVQNWDQHSHLRREHTKLAYETDRPIAGLLADLKRTGLFGSTLVVWGGEFGRSPTSQDFTGRDHNRRGFTMWMAGGGVRPGVRYGATDEFGSRAVEDPVSVHDLHATILHLLGIDHESLTFRFGGRDQTPTAGLGHVIRPILA